MMTIVLIIYHMLIGFTLSRKGETMNDWPFWSMTVATLFIIYSYPNPLYTSIPLLLTFSIDKFLINTK